MIRPEAALLALVLLLVLPAPATCMEPGEIWVRGDATLLAEVEKDLARTPQRRPVRSIRTGEPWPAQNETVLAIVDLENAGPNQSAIRIGRCARRIAPGWLAHAALRAARATGSIVRGEPGLPLIGQLVTRSVRSEPAREEPPAPCLTLLIGGDHAAGVRLTSATIRRLDALEGAPLPEAQYLIAGGRVHLRRSLYWLALVLWIALMWCGRGRKTKYLREYRWCWLLTVLVAPAASLVLLTVTTLMSLGRAGARLRLAIGLVLPVLYVASTGLGLAAGALRGISVFPILLIAGALMLFVLAVRDDQQAGAS